MRNAAAATLLLACSQGCWAQSTGSDETSVARQVSQAPTLTAERSGEDWSVLRDPANRTGRWTEPFKYVRLDPAGHAYLTTGLELRLRNEDYRNLAWGGVSAPDQGYVWTRLLPYADLHVGQMRAFVQPVIAHAVGVRPAPSPVDQTGFDLLQGFVDYRIDLNAEASLRLAAGRQMLSLGSERLVGSRYGPNVPLAFDGGRATLQIGRLAAALFYVRPVENGPHSFDDRTSSERALWGLYATRWFGTGDANGVDLYYLGFRNRLAHFDQESGREMRHTIGVRSFGTQSDWHWNVEGMYQFGRFSGAPIRAWSVGSDFGHTFGFAPLAPDLSLRFDMISGDRDRSKAGLQTFDPLFPRGKYFGALSPVGPQNIVDLHPQIAFQLNKVVSLGLNAMAYWRQSRGDGIYDVPGNLLRSSIGSDARYIGKQAEVVIGWQATPELSVSVSTSLFEAGAFIRETGAARPIKMLGLEANFRY